MGLEPVAPASSTGTDGLGDVFTVLWKRSVESSVDFIEKHLGDALVFPDNLGIRKHALAIAPTDGLVMECGVWVGRSINAFADQMTERGDTRTIYGFDSFEGLSEDWSGHHVEKGFFNLDGQLPEVRPNVSLIKGWVDDTIPQFLFTHSEPIAFLHVDTDTYSPCKTILTECRHRLRPGSVILFDELLAYPGWWLGEFKALNECFKPEEYRWRAFGKYGAALEIIKLG